MGITFTAAASAFYPRMLLAAGNTAVIRRPPIIFGSFSQQLSIPNAINARKA